MTPINNTHCTDCPAYYLHTKSTPEEMRGKTLHYGDRVCTHGKNIRKFGKRDPKVQIPSWCPRRLSPPMLRIYAFKSKNDMLMQLMLKAGPAAHRYYMMSEVPATMTAKEFWNQRHDPSINEQLPCPIVPNWVIEFDDGIRSICFRSRSIGFELLSGFDATAARANQRKEDTES